MSRRIWRLSVSFKRSLAKSLLTLQGYPHAFKSTSQTPSYWGNNFGHVKDYNLGCRSTLVGLGNDVERTPSSDHGSPPSCGRLVRGRPEHSSQCIGDRESACSEITSWCGNVQSKPGACGEGCKACAVKPAQSHLPCWTLVHSPPPPWHHARIRMRWTRGATLHAGLVPGWGGCKGACVRGDRLTWLTL